MTSVPPPAENPTIILIGLSGNLDVCAALSLPTAQAASARPNAKRHDLFMITPGHDEGRARQSPRRRDNTLRGALRHGSPRADKAGAPAYYPRPLQEKRHARRARQGVANGDR